MRIVAAVLAATLLVAAVGAYAWDAAKKDQIVQGVHVGGVSVGGLTADQARQRLNHRLVEPLDQPVTVQFDHTRYVLSPEKLDLRADLNAMVDEAIGASRSGILPVRVWRYATGGEVDREITPRISYSSDALDEFVNTVAAKIDRDPVDASVAPSADSLNLVPGRDGVTVRTGQLRGQVAAAIESPSHRTIRPTVDRVKASLTTDDLAQKYPVYLTLDRASYQLRLWKDLKVAKTYTVAVGQAGLETPAGLYTINDKQVNPSWHVPDSAWAGDLAGKVIPPGPADPIKARWMGFFDGAGIHGTDDLSSLGTSASHGCVRMSIPDVIELYPQVPLGTPIYVG